MISPGSFLWPVLKSSSSAGFEVIIEATGEPDENAGSAHTTDPKHPNPIGPNILARRFEPAAPHRVWVTDVAYI